MPDLQDLPSSDWAPQFDSSWQIQVTFPCSLYFVDFRFNWVLVLCEKFERMNFQGREVYPVDPNTSNSWSDSNFAALHTTQLCAIYFVAGELRIDTISPALLLFTQHGILINPAHVPVSTRSFQRFSRSFKWELTILTTSQSCDTERSILVVTTEKKVESWWDASPTQQAVNLTGCL